MCEFRDRVTLTYPKATCRHASHPHGPIQPDHQLPDMSTTHLDRLHYLRLVCAFNIKEFQPHEHQPPAYLPERVLDRGMDPDLLWRQHAEWDARCLRCRAALHHRRRPARVGG